jgi:hypothetical protein
MKNPTAKSLCANLKRQYMDCGKHHGFGIDRFMKKKGFKQCRSYISIYVQTKQGQVVYLVFYVDNLSILNKSLDEVKKVKLVLLKPNLTFLRRT